MRSLLLFSLVLALIWPCLAYDQSLGVQLLATVTQAATNARQANRIAFATTQYDGKREYQEHARMARYAQFAPDLSRGSYKVCDVIIRPGEAQLVCVRDSKNDYGWFAYLVVDFKQSDEAYKLVHIESFEDPQAYEPRG